MHFQESNDIIKMPLTIQFSRRQYHCVHLLMRKLLCVVKMTITILCRVILGNCNIKVYLYHHISISWKNGNYQSWCLQEKHLQYLGVCIYCGIDMTPRLMSGLSLSTKFNMKIYCWQTELILTMGLNVFKSFSSSTPISGLLSLVKNYTLKKFLWY